MEVSIDTHGIIGNTYLFQDLEFLSLGSLLYTNIYVPCDNLKNFNTPAKVTFNNGISLNVLVTVSNIDSLKFSCNIQSLWHAIDTSSFVDFKKEVLARININKNIYNLVKNNPKFVMLLECINIPHNISFYELFNNQKVIDIYKWKHSNGFCLNELIMKFEICGRNAEEILIPRYIEEERVHPDDCLRDKIDDALLLMKKNGDRYFLQCSLFYKYFKKST